MNTHSDNSATPTPSRTAMGHKPILYREAKTILNLTNEEFERKKLCDGITFSTGDFCAFSCQFCYVLSLPLRFVDQPVLDRYNLESGRGMLNPCYAKEEDSKGPRIIAKEGKTLLTFRDVVIRRSHSLDVLKSQLYSKEGVPLFKYDVPARRVVYSSPLVDVAANAELVKETAAACNLILDATNWDIRLLSKSSFLPELVQQIEKKHRYRMILGVSTGTLDDRVAAAIETGTHPVSKRIKSLHWLQDNGYRTFGMICPSLPQPAYDKFSSDICNALRIDRCEHVWAEVINVRGESLKRTLQGLLDAGLHAMAEGMKEVMDSCEAWENYAKATFEAHARNIPANKLRFLQYLEKDTYSSWKAQEKHGAVLLGKYVKEMEDIEGAPAAAIEAVGSSRSDAAKKAWVTMREKYSPAVIKSRAIAAAKKAAATRRKNRQSLGQLR